jgi:hypothetical protein
MGSGISGSYQNTRGSMLVPASLDIIGDNNDLFKRHMSRRRDVDVGGYLDIVAHGTSRKVRLTDANGHHDIGHRELARLIKNREDYKRKGVRLLSCETGKGVDPIAQDLTNKLGVPVKAPTELFWGAPTGSHFVAEQLDIPGEPLPDYNKMGFFKTFYPGGNKNAR